MRLRRMRPKSDLVVLGLVPSPCLLISCCCSSSRLAVATLFHHLRPFIVIFHTSPHVHFFFASFWSTRQQHNYCKGSPQ